MGLFRNKKQFRRNYSIAYYKKIYSHVILINRRRKSAYEQKPKTKKYTELYDFSFLGYKNIDIGVRAIAH